MNIATLRASGTDTALESLRIISGLVIAREWRKGDARRRRGTYETSGFNACVADTDSSQELMLVVRTFLENCHRMGVVFSSDSLDTELDIGLSVGGIRSSRPAKF